MLAADVIGAAEWQLQTTTEYARTRTQFERPLGFFQAVKHPLVNVMIQIDEAKSLVYNAACAIDHEPNAQRNMPTWSRPPQVKMLRSPAADQYNSTVA
jgi:alkylation response protein AidB-like acyl-CoA dehydrogenase